MNKEVFVSVDDIADARRKKKNRQAFYTPLSLVSQMIELAGVHSGSQVLEPSAGDGRIVYALINEGCQVDACETEEAMRERCRSLGANIIGADFLKVQRTKYYNAIVMNPPFQKGQAQKHIEHAARFLARHGKLIAIAPTSLAEVIRELRLNVPKTWHVTYERLPRETFKESGTCVETLLVDITEMDICLESDSVLGFYNLATANAALSIETNQDLLKAFHKSQDDRTKQMVRNYIAEHGGSVYAILWGQIAKYLNGEEYELKEIEES